MTKRKDNQPTLLIDWLMQSSEDPEGYARALQEEREALSKRRSYRIAMLGAYDEGYGGEQYGLRDEGCIDSRSVEEPSEEDLQRARERAEWGREGLIIDVYWDARSQRIICSYAGVETTLAGAF